MTPPLPRLDGRNFKDPVPPIQDQASAAGFEAGIFDFGAARQKDVWYFNTGLVDRPDGRWLIARRSRNDPTLRVGINDLVRFKLEGLTPRFMAPIAMPKQFTDEHFEDPRAVHANGRTWIMACDFLWSRRAMRWTGAHQVLASFDEDWVCRGRFDLPIGNNGTEVGGNSGHEKNHVPFFHDGILRIIYRGCPHQVYTVDLHNGNKLYLNESPWKSCWPHGEIRGGTPPVQVGDEYWTFFHSSYPALLNRPTRRYVMGAYAFEARPPFKITRISRTAILTGSLHNNWSVDKPATVFACGASLENNEWLITGGANDLDTFWCKIKHSVVEKGMVRVK